MFCDKCPDEIHCCIFKGKPGFTFTGIEDAKRIKKYTGKDYDYFMDYSPLTKSTIRELKNCDPSLEGALRFSQLKDSCLPRLKTKKNGYCIFLDDKRKCEIYKVRPKICRIYPFWGIKLLNGRLKVICHDSENECGIKKCDEKEIKKLFNQIRKEKY